MCMWREETFIKSLKDDGRQKDLLKDDFKKEILGSNTSRP